MTTEQGVLKIRIGDDQNRRIVIEALGVIGKSRDEAVAEAVSDACEQDDVGVLLFLPADRSLVDAVTKEAWRVAGDGLLPEHVRHGAVEIEKALKKAGAEDPLLAAVRPLWKAAGVPVPKSLATAQTGTMTSDTISSKQSGARAKTPKKLARVIERLAKGSNTKKIRRFEDIARAYFAK